MGVQVPLPAPPVETSPTNSIVSKGLVTASSMIVDAEPEEQHLPEVIAHGKLDRVLGVPDGLEALFP